MANINELVRRVDTLTRELKQAQEDLATARIAESPIKIGDIFMRQKRVGFGSKERIVEERGRAEKFHHAGTLVQLRLLKKDGSDSQFTKTMYGWDNWQKVSP